ncbi:MAG: CehA/McbA family metallohydrolase [Vicinamibacterales bacterium]
MKTNRGQSFRRRRVGRFGIIALVALAVAFAALLPPRAQDTPIPSWTITAPTIRGAYHIHSNRSDGAGTLDDIAEAASRAGLQFVIVTDHGDGTRPPEPPSYRYGVLCLDGVELSTNDGHYVALGLSAAPYQLAGTAESVIEDVTRFGGFGIVAHADSARPSLQWRAWDQPFDALEWLSIDTEWRDEPWSALARAAVTYWARGPAALSSLLDRPRALIARWDNVINTRRAPVLAAADAHARLGIRQRSDPDTDGWYLPMPRYESSFRVFSNHVVLDRPFGRDPVDDGARLLAAIRQGRVFTVLDGLATPGAFEFVATSRDRTSSIGEVLPLQGHAIVRARVAAPAGASMVLLRDGSVVQQTTDSELSAEVTTPGAYRIEVSLPGHSSIPWLFSNPIYVGFDQPAPASEPAPGIAPIPVALGQAGGETSAGSSTELDGNAEIVWRYRLASGTPAGQYAAVRVPVSGLSEATRVRFDVNADRPMRVWVQLRRPGGVGERWGRTVYVDETKRSIDLEIERLAPIGVTTTARAAMAVVDSLLFVVDTVNTRSGSSGTVRFSNVGFARSAR